MSAPAHKPPLPRRRLPPLWRSRWLGVLFIGLLLVL